MRLHHLFQLLPIPEPMTAYLIVSLTALIAAGLTLYSGFGLGTMLLPVFALFFPIEMAVVATALVHGANNVFKVSLLGRHADREVVLKFGLPAIAAAIFGALALGWFAQSESALTINVNETAFSKITPVKLVIGLLMIGFALFECILRLNFLSIYIANLNNINQVLRALKLFGD